jgi:hypothetical protein
MTTTMKWGNDPRNGKQLIIAGEPAPCATCQKRFGRFRFTARYCNACGDAFCEGEHGSFAIGTGLCVRC